MKLLAVLVGVLALTGLSQAFGFLGGGGGGKGGGQKGGHGGGYGGYQTESYSYQPVRVITKHHAYPVYKRVPYEVVKKVPVYQPQYRTVYKKVPVVKRVPVVKHHYRTEHVPVVKHHYKVEKVPVHVPVYVDKKPHYGGGGGGYGHH